jgi:ferredoxin
MKIRLDRTRCDGFGRCAVHAPQRFSLDDWGYAVLVGDGEIAPAEQDAVRRALLDCPAHAVLDGPEPEPPR